METGQCPHRQGKRKESRRLSKRSRSIRSCKGAKRRQPKRDDARAGGLFGRRNPACELRQQQAPHKLKRNLHQGRGIVLLHSEKPEAERQKKRVSGQPDQSGSQLPVRRGKSVAAVQQQVFCQRPINQRVSIDLKEILQHPKAHDEARRERRRGNQRGAKTTARLRRRELRSPQLTLRVGFHTIRNV